MSFSLVIAEKPSVAKDYANAVGGSITTKDGYIEGSNYIFTWAFGHLFELYKPEDYKEEYKSWDISYLPIIPEEFKIKLIDNPGIKKQYKVIKELINRTDVDKVYVGTDAGREGELIARYILQGLKNKKPAFRIWLSSMTKEEIIKAFDNPVPLSHYDNLFYSAQARAECDWLLGINFSRAYTVKNGNKVTLSIGRCQTPILSMICKRDNEIENFKHVPYWELVAEFSAGYKGKYINNIKDKDTKITSKAAAEQLKDSLSGQHGIITDIITERKKKSHPLLFDLTTLQRNMNKKYGYTAQEVLDIAQALYEKHKILTYPRTDSRHITENMASELPEVISNLQFGKFKEAAQYCLKFDKLPVTKRLADSSKVTDHHAIIPTKNKNIFAIYDELNNDERKVFDEVVSVFLAAFMPDYIYDSITIYTDVSSHKFITKGITVVQPGWMSIYHESDENNDKESDEDNIQSNLPELHIQDVVCCNSCEVLNKKTTPPPRYNDNLLLNIMENPTGMIDDEELREAIKNHGIGTPATRASIIEVLLKRGYIKREKKNIIATQLGKDLINYIDIDLLKSPELTAEWEHDLELIAAGEYSKEKFIEKTIDFIKDGIKKVIDNPVEVVNCVEKNSFDNVILGKCPKCKTGDIIENKAGYGCSMYKNPVNPCNFFIPHSICGKKISSAQAKKLVLYGKTDKIKGFKSKKPKNPSFDAALILDDNCNITFQF